MSALAIDISTSETAELLDVSCRRVQQLHDEGVIPKSARGRHPLLSTVQGYVRSLRDEMRRASRSAAASRVADARARHLELRTAREAGELIELESALSIVDEMIGTYRSEYASLPARVTRDPTLRIQIEDEMDRIQRQIADKFASRAGELREPPTTRRRGSRS